jgi:superfamily II DNA/RNA helicase
LPIKDYVSEKIESILDTANINKKIIASAETGTGKTTAFVKEFHKHRPSKRLIILATLTAIVDQIKAENDTVISLTGKSSPSDHTKAKTASLVVANYEQGYKHLSEGAFNKKKRLALTTSIIDEGLSIEQEGFTDVVFIETEYNRMAESLKQLYARFRNIDPNRKNYFYYRETTIQTIIN